MPDMPELPDMLPVSMAVASRLNLLLATLVALFIMTDAHPSSYRNYSTITGFFLQDDPTTNASTFDYVSLQSDALFASDRDRTETRPRPADKHNPRPP